MIIYALFFLFLNFIGAYVQIHDYFDGALEIGASVVIYGIMVFMTLSVIL